MDRERFAHIRRAASEVSADTSVDAQAGTHQVKLGGLSEVAAV